MRDRDAPKHIGIILDGNRRYAKKLGLNPWKGHEKGAEKFRNFLDWCEELGIKEVTAYCFSIQNFNRAKDEIEFLMKLFKESAFETLKKENFKLLKEKDVKVKFIGRIHLLPAEIQELIKEIEEKTKEHNTHKINIAIAYGGREEITDAFKQIAEKISSGEVKPEGITENMITEHLQLQNDPDLIIRTSGEKRMSNFLPWQSNYSEWFFIDKTWPEIEKEDLIKIFEDFKTRQRRFGK